MTWEPCGKSSECLMLNFHIFHRTDLAGFLVCYLLGHPRLNGDEKNSVAVCLMLNHSLTGLEYSVYEKRYLIQISAHFSPKSIKIPVMQSL